MFATGTVTTALGFDAPELDSVGPFLRTRERELTVEIDVTRQAGFPADGLAQLRAVVTAVVDAYLVGQQVWYNDLLRAAEGVGGTRVTSLVVQHSSVDVSGVEPPLDVLWTLPSANLTITVT